MSTNVEWKEILLSVASILAAGGLTLVIKSLFYKYKRPNGKKGGVVSFHATAAFAIVTVIAMTTKDWFLTGLAAILAYLIGRGRMDEGQHYMYQVVFGAIIGVLVPFGIFYAYNKKFGGGNDNSYYREEYDDKPERAVDERHEADEAPELRLDDLEDF